MRKGELQMIKLVEIRTGSTFWEIDGVTVRFQRKKSVGDALTKQLIEEYRELLIHEAYRDYPVKICEIDNLLGDIVLLRIGVEVYFEAFMKMFAYYTEGYIEAWSKSDKKFVTNRTSMFPVFVYMFKKRMVDTSESPVSILKNISCNKKDFLEIYEAKFSDFWIEKIVKKVKEEELLDDIREKLEL